MPISQNALVRPRNWTFPCDRQFGFNGSAKKWEINRSLYLVATKFVKICRYIYILYMILLLWCIYCVLFYLVDYRFSILMIFWNISFEVPTRDRSQSAIFPSTLVIQAATRVFSNAAGSYSANVGIAIENGANVDEDQLQARYHRGEHHKQVLKQLRREIQYPMVWCLKMLPVTPMRPCGWLRMP